MAAHVRHSARHRSELFVELPDNCAITRSFSRTKSVLASKATPTVTKPMSPRIANTTASEDWSLCNLEKISFFIFLMSRVFPCAIQKDDPVTALLFHNKSLSLPIATRRPHFV